LPVAVDERFAASAVAELCQELRLGAVADFYSGIAQGAAGKQATFADFLEETYAPSGMLAGLALATCSPASPVSR
jgi:hypothetical protein